MQKWVEKHYDLILDVCKNLTANYTDLAHDIILKLSHRNQPAPDEEIRYYIYTVAKNHYINYPRNQTTGLIYDPPVTEERLEKDPFEYIQKLKAFRLKEPILGIALELYYFHEGNVTDIERSMKDRGCGVCRQTLSKYIEEAKTKIRLL